MIGQPLMVAAAQTVPQDGNVAANIAEHVRLIEEAARQGVRLIVFPELSLSGYVIADAPSLAFTIQDPRLLPLQACASRHRITVVAGAPVAERGALYIGALLFERERARLYTKHHLGAFSEAARCDGEIPPAEASVFQPGTENPSLWLGARRVAFAVCADVGRPHHAAAAAAIGATIYACSMFVIPSELERDRPRLRDAVRAHRMGVIFANFGGPSGGLRSGGRSAVIAPDGATLAELPAQGSGLAIATIS